MELHSVSRSHSNINNLVFAKHALLPDLLFYVLFLYLRGVSGDLC